MKTLNDFLLKKKASNEYYDFAKDLTLEQFFNTCHRGDWILWLFARTNPESLRELTLAKGHCANTVRHLMTDERSKTAVDTAIKYGEGKASKKELKKAYASPPPPPPSPSPSPSSSSFYATPAAYAAYAVEAFYADGAASYAALAFYAFYAASYDYGAEEAEAAKRANQKLTANICRHFLPLEIWNINKED